VSDIELTGNASRYGILSLPFEDGFVVEFLGNEVDLLLSAVSK
jgi:hypothetical protein